MSKPTNVRQAVETLVPHLPGTWTVAQLYDHLVAITRDDGVALYCRLVGGRLHVRTDTPEMPGGGQHTPRYYCIDEDEIEVTVAGDRDPEVIARDLVRRLIEPWTPTLQRVLPARTAKLAERQAAQDTFDRIAQLSGGSIRGGPLLGGQDAHIAFNGAFSVDIRVMSSGNCELMVRSMPGPAAVRLVEAMMTQQRE
jgi:hypothetical protein